MFRKVRLKLNEAVEGLSEAREGLGDRVRAGYSFFGAI